MPNFPLIELPSSVAFVCHDAGAANIIYSWMQEQLVTLPDVKRDWRLFALGPAARLQNNYDLPHVYLCESIDDVLDAAEALISGTGWASNVEYDSIVASRQRDIRSIAIVDHWVNYRERFVRNGVEVLPDEIWVTDFYAKKLVEREFKNIKITQIQNLYLVNLVQEVKLVEEVGGVTNNLLYLLEPIRNSWGDDVVDGEFHALDFFVNNIGALEINGNISIKLRLHPSEPYGKYDKWIKDHKSLNVSIDESKNLAEGVAWSDIVVGCQTYAMVVALEAGRKVYCSIPPGYPGCVLPQKNIIKLSEIIK